MSSSQSDDDSQYARRMSISEGDETGNLAH